MSRVAVQKENVAIIKNGGSRATFYSNVSNHVKCESESDTTMMSKPFFLNH